MNTSTGQKKFSAAKLSVATSEAALLQNSNNRDNSNLRYELTETKRHLIKRGDYFSIGNSRTKIPAIFRGISGIFVVF
jgi:hypothetical protein